MKQYRKPMVVMIGACMLAVVLATGAMANEFYEAGTTEEIGGADNLGKTIVHYIVTLGLPLVSAGLLTGGLVKMRRDPGSGGGLLASGVGAGYIAQIVNNLHSTASASVGLVPIAVSGGIPGLGLALQAACLAGTALYVKRRRALQCGSAAEASSTNP